MIVLDLLRIILLLASAASFGPQVQRIRSHRACDGLAPSYLLLNLVSAAEQFAPGLHILVVNDPGTSWLVRSPPDAGGYLNVLQFAAVWLGHLVLFGHFLWYPPRRPAVKTAATTLYLLFLCISLLPVLFEASLFADGPAGPDKERDLFAGMFAGIHTVFLAPVITALTLGALLPQLRELRRLQREDRGGGSSGSSSRTGALSTEGLALQAVVFLAAALFWPFRFHMPLLGIPWGYWYQTIGWAAVDGALFALVQAVLWHVAGRSRRQPPREEAGSGETAPLLEDEAAG